MLRTVRFYGRHERDTAGMAALLILAFSKNRLKPGPWRTGALPPDGLSPSAEPDRTQTRRGYEDGFRVVNTKVAPQELGARNAQGACAPACGK